MSTAHLANAGVYTDMSGLQALKGKVKSADPDSIKEVAKQFEAVLMQMMLSSMRKTISFNEEFSNEKEVYYDMFDKQIALNMSQKGGFGIADAMMRQLSKDIPEQKTEEKQIIQPVSVNRPRETLSADTNELKPVTKAPAIAVKQQSDTDEVDRAIKPRNVIDDENALNTGSPAEFIKSMLNIARETIKSSGLDPRPIIAQAALETGWGKHIMKSNAGESSHNLFGIKKGSNWQGQSVTASTLEFDGNRMTKQRETFRAYESIVESINDYIKFIKTNVRYQDVVKNSNDPVKYATALQESGYATDPQYAQKLISIMNRPEFKQAFDI